MIRGLLVGAGQVAHRGHIPAYLGDPLLSREVRLVAVVDSSPENLQACQGPLPGARLYSRLEDALANEELEFVDLCTPPHARVNIIREATRRGWHILCEKPLARRLRDGLEIAGVVRSRDPQLVFMPCFQYQFAPLWRAVLREVKGGALGEVHLASFESYRQQADPGSPNWRKGWRQRRDIAGGGVLLDIGTHYLHLVKLLFGMPATIMAQMVCLSGATSDVEDTALLLLRYPRRLVDIRVSWASSARENRIRLIGSEGSISCDGTTLRLEGRRGSQAWHFPDSMDKAAYPTWYAELFRVFAAAVQRGGGEPASMDDALAVSAMTEAAYCSAAEGRVVALAEQVA